MILGMSGAGDHNMLVGPVIGRIFLTLRTWRGILVIEETTNGRRYVL
jgi:hypothetical protein